MTTEDDFQAALDADPEDWQTRVVFADWLQEHGDARAEGYRALGVLRLRPEFSRSEQFWVFTEASWAAAVQPGGIYPKARIPDDWFALAHDSERDRTESWFGYQRTRREVEDTAALAFAKLPEERRAELLAGVAPTAATPAPPESKARTRKKPAPKKAKGKK